jgi:hypothetical protein
MREPPTILSWPIAVLALLILLSAVLLTAVHLGNLYAAHHVPGIWMVLAQYLNHGVFYPPLQDDGFYAGTRYTPLFFTLVAGLARLTPDYLLAAKLAALGSVALLAAGLLVSVRWITGRWVDAIGLAGLLLAFPQGLNAAIMPHADALAAGLSTWGLIALAADRTKPRIGTPALLFTLAVTAKFSSVAAPAAALLFFLARDRRKALGLVLLCLLLGACAMALVQGLSHGRFLENLGALGSGGTSGESFRLMLERLLSAIRFSPSFALLLPLLLAGVLVRASLRRIGLWDWYFLAALVTTMFVYTSPGTADNHLLELEVAGILLAAQLLADFPMTNNLLVLVRLLLRPVILAGLLLGLRPHLGTWHATEAEGVLTRAAVNQAIPPQARLLTEAPLIPVLRGQRPVIMDAFAFQVLASRGLIDDRALARRIEQREFDVLILLGRIDRPEETFAPHTHFGPRVTQAIQDHYQFQGRLGAFVLFVPDKSPGAASKPRS